MKKSNSLLHAAAISLFPSIAFAGGYDLTGQPAGIIFEEGNYVEAQVGTIIPDVKGSAFINPPGVTSEFGNVANTTPFFTGGVKFDVTDEISGALIIDRPFLRSTTYNQGLYVGTDADVDAMTLTALGRYKLTDNFSVFGGPRLQFASVDLSGPQNLPANGIPFPPYSIDVKDRGLGFAAGVAAEIPKYKARVAVTYNSQIDHKFDSVETFGLASVPGKFKIHTPQSVNLDIQAPVSNSTLVKANIRWVEWGGVDFRPPFFESQTGRPVVEYTEDTITYRLTVAQRINEKLVGFVTGSFEDDGGENISLFKTVDGHFSAGGGAIYQINDALSLQLAGEYRWLQPTGGRQIPNVPINSTFDDDANAIALSMKLGYRF